MHGASGPLRMVSLCPPGTAHLPAMQKQDRRHDGQPQTVPLHSLQAPREFHPAQACSLAAQDAADHEAVFAFITIRALGAWGNKTENPRQFYVIRHNCCLKGSVCLQRTSRTRVCLLGRPLQCRFLVRPISAVATSILPHLGKQFLFSSGVEQPASQHVLHQKQAVRQSITCVRTCVRACVCVCAQTPKLVSTRR